MLNSNLKRISAEELANYLVFINQGNFEYGDVLTNLKIQKLLYYIQGFHLAFFDQPIFNDKIVAWKYGPVVEEVYQKLKIYNDSAVELDKEKVKNAFSLGNEQKRLIDSISKQIGQYSAWKLVEMTHSEDPWKNTVLNQEISQEDLRSFFKTKIAR